MRGKMDFISEIGILGGLLTPVYVFIFVYVLRNEHRLTCLETRCKTFHGDSDER
jgi:hypothetical protein